MDDWVFNVGLVISAVMLVGGLIIIPILASNYRSRTYNGKFMLDPENLMWVLPTFAMSLPLLAVGWLIILPLAALVGGSFLFYIWLNGREVRNEKVEVEIRATRSKINELKKLKEELAGYEAEFAKLKFENPSDLK